MINEPENDLSEVDRTKFNEGFLKKLAEISKISTTNTPRDYIPDEFVERFEDQKPETD